MDKKLGENKIVFKDDLNFREYMKFTALSQKMSEGQLERDDYMFDALGILLKSWNDKTGDEAIKEIEKLTDANLFMEITEAFGEVTENLVQKTAKKKK